jgi:hypothetical protein
MAGSLVPGGVGAMKDGAPVLPSGLPLKGACYRCGQYGRYVDRCPMGKLCPWAVTG